MYIRVRKNKSGTSTVYLLHSVRLSPLKNPTAKVIKCFGSTDDPTLLNFLIFQAESLKALLSDQPLPEIGAKFVHDIDDISDISVAKLGIQSFYSQVFQSLFPSLLSSPKDMQNLMDLITMRIASPSSKLKTASSSKQFVNIDLEVSKIYRLMDKLNDQVIEKIKLAVFNNTAKCLGHIEVMFYDLTTISFENNSQSELKEFGFSKDGKHQHVQVSLALIVSDQGLPVGYEIFKGNTFEGSTFIPTLNKLKDKYGVKDVTVVADSAMLSQANIKALNEQKFKYIISARIRNLDAKVTKEVINQDNYSSSDEIKYKPIQLDDDTRLISAFSSDRQRKDQKDREKAVAKAEKFVEKNSKTAFKSSLKKPFIKVDKDSKIQLDQDKIDESKKLDGYFGFITNTDLSPAEVMKKYKGLWQVEQSFRITKHNLKVRPIFHNKDRRIKAHFAICYLAFAIIRHVEFILKKENLYLPLEQLNDYLKQIDEISLRANGKTVLRKTTTIPKKISSVFAALNIKSPQKYIQKKPQTRIKVDEKILRKATKLPRKLVSVFAAFNIKSAQKDTHKKFKNISRRSVIAD